MGIDKNLTVSVIIPTYYGEKYIAHTLASISQQTILPDQLVISDDGSTDMTIELINDFVESCSFEVIVKYHDGDGVTNNYLNAIKYTCGDIIMVADQDDVWMPDKIEVTIRAFNQNSALLLVSSDSLLVDAELQSLHTTIRGGESASRSLTNFLNSGDEYSNFQSFLKGGLPFLAHSLTFKKQLIPTLLDKPISINNWWFEEWLTCVAASVGRIGAIQESLTLYRQHHRQTSGGFVITNKETKEKLSQTELYRKRIEKMHYCRQLILENYNCEKKELIENYILFLEFRSQLKTKTKTNALQSIIRKLFEGQYHKFSKNHLSAISDVLRVLGIK